MSPSAEERLAALEAEKDHVKELLKEIKKDLRFLPSRISRRTKKQLAECRAMQNKKQLPDDYGWLKKFLAVLLALGSAIGGAVYQYQEAKKPASQQITQGGNR